MTSYSKLDNAMIWLKSYLFLACFIQSRLTNTHHIKFVEILYAVQIHKSLKPFLLFSRDNSIFILHYFRICITSANKGNISWPLIRACPFMISVLQFLFDKTLTVHVKKMLMYVVPVFHVVTWLQSDHEGQWSVSLKQPCLTCMNIHDYE